VLGKERQHRFQDAGVHGGCGVVIEVNGKLHNRPPSICTKTLLSLERLDIVTALRAFTSSSFTFCRGSRTVQRVIWPHSRLSVTQLVTKSGPSMARITSKAEISLGGRASA